MQTVALVALPVFYSAYVGVAEAARDLALRFAERRKDDVLTTVTVGEMENELVTAQVAHASMMDLVVNAKPGPTTTIAVFCRRTILVNGVTACVEKALETAGGAGFYRARGLERAFRDIQAARYHPIPERAQTALTGRVLLGLGLDG